MSRRGQQSRTLFNNILKLHFFTLLSNMTFNQTSSAFYLAFASPSRVIQSTSTFKTSAGKALIQRFKVTPQYVLMKSNIAMTTNGLKAPWRTVMSVLWVVTYNGEERDIV